MGIHAPALAGLGAAAGWCAALVFLFEDGRMNATRLGLVLIAVALGMGCAAIGSATKAILKKLA